MLYYFGCKYKTVAIRGVSDGSRLEIYCTKPCPASALPFFVLRECYCDIAMHTFCFMGSLLLAINTAVSAHNLLYPFRRFRFCFVSLFFVVFALFSFLCSSWSFSDLPLIFSCPAGHILRNRVHSILPGKVKARSLDVKKTTTVCTVALSSDLLSALA